jgi:4-amino-4-deoxy-L-arabinose transferase-like glycosyltransferase
LLVGKVFQPWGLQEVRAKHLMDHHRQRFPWILVALIGCAYLFSVWAGSDRFSITPFREAQTAITSYYMAKGESPFLAYHVPVLGTPWAVPMEFPLFQWLVAKIGGTDIDTLRWTGRLMSVAFWTGCLWLGWLIAGRAPVGREDRKWWVLLLASAPIFIAYSPTFLIETFTLFFALAYLWTYLRLRERLTLVNLVLACGFGVLAALSKPTTWAPFAGVLILATTVDLWIALRERTPLRTIALKAMGPGMAVAVPLMAALVWVHYGDAVKLENPLASNLTSENLSRWNYGSLQQKLSPIVWAVILVKQGLLTLGPGALLLPIVLVIAGWKWIQDRRLNPLLIWTGLAVAGYFSAPIVFTNLHFRHDYYTAANAFFLLSAFVLAVASLRERLPEKVISWSYRLVLVFAVVTGFGYTALRKSLTEPQETALVASLETLENDGGVIFFGFDWGAQMPYEIERRALMLNMDDPADPRFQQAIEANKHEPWIAMAIAGERYAAIAEAARAGLDLEFPYTAEVWPGVQVWSETPIAAASINGEPELLSRVSRKLSGGVGGKSGFIFIHSLLTPEENGEGILEVMYRRRDDLFYIDASAGRLYRLRNYF